MTKLAVLLALNLFVFLSLPEFTLAQWTQLPPQNELSCEELWVEEPYILVGTQDGSILRSTDAGLTWGSAGNGIPEQMVLTELYGADGKLFVGGDSGAFISTNKGESWRSITASFPGPRTVYTFYGYGGYLYMAGDSGMQRSIDGGETWSNVGEGLPARRIVSMGHYGPYLYAGLRRVGVYKSLDSGRTWQSCNMSWTYPMNAIVTGEGFVFVGSNSLHLFRSTDDGGSWESVENRIKASMGMSTMGSLLAIGKTIFLGTDGGLARSTDLGETWDTLNTGIPRRPHCIDLKVSGTHMYIGARDQWIWRRPLSELLPPASAKDAAAPYALHLGQSTPNPANSSTEIHYMVPASGHVTLKLYDGLMQEVATIIDERQDAGLHRGMVDVSKLPAGVYYYRLTSGTSSVTRRMVVMR